MAQDKSTSEEFFLMPFLLFPVIPDCTLLAAPGNECSVNITPTLTPMSIGPTWPTSPPERLSEAKLATVLPPSTGIRSVLMAEGSQQMVEELAASRDPGSAQLLSDAVGDFPL